MLTRVVRTSVALLVMAGLGAIVPSTGNTPRLTAIPASALPSGPVMLWYEDETFEDCGTPSLAPDQCTDLWLPALPHGVESEECDRLSTLYNATAREEFVCAPTRPATKQDDAP